MPKKNHDSYCLFKKQTSSGKIWYVKFWDNDTCRYSSFNSTGIPVEVRENAAGKRKKRRKKCSILLLKKNHIQILPKGR